ncbi:MAG: cytochrome b/b6 domain-containing protein [Anaerolineales bacterium]|nr:cytochrome b/b6 domain-containing protein [Anaerolineales bacterium]
MGKRTPRLNRISRIFILTGFSLIIIAGAVLFTKSVVSARTPEGKTEQASPLHPSFPFLDEDGINVLASGNPVSTMNTCGSCHDSAFIADHSYHVSAGLNDLGSPGSTITERPWDISPGFFGSWNSIVYRYLSPQGDENVDLTTPDWIRLYGLRHVGGGPAMVARDGQLLTDLNYSRNSLETNSINPVTGELDRWDWQESGIVEMNCFLCHTPNPNNETRAMALEKGEFKWANSSTLAGTEIIYVDDGTYTWNTDAFDENNEIQPEIIQIQDPTNNNCGLCHGLVHDNVEDPLITLGCSPETWSTVTTGQIISPQKMADSGMNLANKEELNRSWDIHAERLLNCVDCHYSINNPLFYQESENSKPDHLVFDPRRVDIGEYLEKPLHQFARGNSAQSQVAPELNDTMRTCESCHTVGSSHDWLPYVDSHMEALSCETCHIPRLYSSANMVHDWTVLLPEDLPRRECRGTEGDVNTMGTLLTGYEPVLLPSPDKYGDMKLAPHNLITTWFWIYDDPPRPVLFTDLQAVYFEDGVYHPGIILRFDDNKDGSISAEEMVINTDAKADFVRDRLQMLGLSNPRITGEIQPYSISHDVASSDWALADCTACHGEESRITQPIKLAAVRPGNALPNFVPGSDRNLTGSITEDEYGNLYYDPASSSENLYIFGHNNLAWLDWIGLSLFTAVFLGVVTHGGLRLYFASRQTPEEKETNKVLMYGTYERMWHWLQTGAIVLLLLTGLVIHRPDTFGFMDFRNVVLVHNIVAIILALNAALALFYHLASGDIKQYIPRPKGFFDRAFTQAIYYLKGIFKGEHHPFEKTPERKLNPLQQVVYIGLLNILLPLQGITGMLMMGVQRWPSLASSLGGLPVLAPAHTIIAWLFSSFLVLHVYLTTTGHTAVSSLEAMITGWEDVEI